MVTMVTVNMDKKSFMWGSGYASVEIPRVHSTSPGIT